MRPLKDEMLTGRLRTRFYTVYHQNLTHREAIRFEDVPLREETIEALKALGYVN